MNDIIAVLCSDIHLSLKAPIARSAEPDWLEVIKRSLDELSSVAEKYDVPIACSGDVFDRWNPTPELINFAIEHLPTMYAIPGQHDLKNHRYDEIEKSAYWTLVKASIVKDIKKPYLVNNQLSLHPFPWGFDITPMKSGWDHTINLAVIHSYVWTTGHSYPGADKNQIAGKYYEKLKGYDAAVFGDNHSGFIIKNDIHAWGDSDSKGYTSRERTQYIMNCGTLMRRHINEIDYKPQIGLLHSDGSITPHFLDTSKDLFLEDHLIKAKEEQGLNISKFLQELKNLGSDSIDLRYAADKYMKIKKTDDDVRAMVLEAIESE